MTKNTGGPAFPSTNEVEVGNWKTSGHTGMTLRDYFAAKAMQGLLAHPDCSPVGEGYEDITHCVVKEAYTMADAMLAARGEA